MVKQHLAMVAHLPAAVTQAGLDAIGLLMAKGLRSCVLGEHICTTYVQRQPDAPCSQSVLVLVRWDRTSSMTREHGPYVMMLDMTSKDKVQKGSVQQADVHFEAPLQLLPGTNKARWQADEVLTVTALRALLMHC